ncbi:MAG: hypothetical protein PSX81_03105 [bacterium]|nr:hypothetical protein [bacterium]
MEINTYILKGIVHPQRALLTFSKPVISQEIEYGSGVKLQFELNIVCNQITIWIKTSGKRNIKTLRNIGSYITRTACFVYSYTLGHGYSIEITQILCKELGVDYVFGIDVPEIRKRELADKIILRHNEILALTANESGQYIIRCFKDLNQAILDTDDNAFHGFRALESLRQYCRLVYNIDSEKDQWNKLAEITGFGKDYIDEIRLRAFPIRHGNNGAQTDEIGNLNILLKTWNVVDNFILYILDNPVNQG